MTTPRTSENVPTPKATPRMGRPRVVQWAAFSHSLEGGKQGGEKEPMNMQANTTRWQIHGRTTKLILLGSCKLQVSTVLVVR